MILKLKLLFQLLTACVLTAECFSLTLNDLNKLSKQNIRTKRSTLASRVAKKLTDFVPDRYLDNYADDPEYSRKFEPIGNCSNREDVNNFFLNVYSNDTHLDLDQEELETLIKFQIQRGERPEYYENKALYYKCNRKKCFQSTEILEILNLKRINASNFQDVCPFLLYNTELEVCEYDDPEVKKLSKALTWLIGLLFSGVVTLWSWNGLIVFPFISTSIYKYVLTFMISLAFACMSSNGLLNYMPMADGFFEADLNASRSYFYKHLVILAVIFSFFLFERIMKLTAIWRTKKRKVKERIEKKLRKTSKIYDIHDLEEKFANDIDIEEEKECFKKRMLQRGLSIQDVNINIIGNAGTITLNDPSPFERARNERVKLCCTSLTENIGLVRPIGWMAIFGDGLGNFIDGLSIGAAINQGLAQGITTALATWCSNIPQELGDFALLIRSGMTPFQALFFNYMSGNTAFIGCIIGLLFGSNIDSARWIFAISGGTSLYLALGVMLPEINEEFDSGTESFTEKCKITLIQITGMLVGYTVVVILNMYEDSIQV